MWHRTSDSRGFTIQELIVALVVGSILIGYAFELYVFARRIVTHWQKEAEISEVVHSTLNRMTLDVQRANNVEIQGDSVFVMRTDTRVIAVYRCAGGFITRNDVLMNASGSVALSTQPSRTGDLVSLELKGSSGSKELIASSRVLMQTSSTGRFVHGGSGGRPQNAVVH
jgi:prepilin-type N-terminal cleavage/methylation domain-containing protein